MSTYMWKLDVGDGDAVGARGCSSFRMKVYVLPILWSAYAMPGLDCDSSNPPLGQMDPTFYLPL